MRIASRDAKVGVIYQQILRYLQYYAGTAVSLIFDPENAGRLRQIVSDNGAPLPLAVVRKALAMGLRPSTEDPIKVFRVSSHVDVLEKIQKVIEEDHEYQRHASTEVGPAQTRLLRYLEFHRGLKEGELELVLSGPVGNRQLIVMRADYKAVPDVVIQNAISIGLEVSNNNIIMPTQAELLGLVLEKVNADTSFVKHRATIAAAQRNAKSRVGHPDAGTLWGSVAGGDVNALANEIYNHTKAIYDLRHEAKLAESSVENLNKAIAELHYEIAIGAAEIPERGEKTTVQLICEHMEAIEKLREEAGKSGVGRQVDLKVAELRKADRERANVTER